MKLKHYRVVANGDSAISIIFNESISESLSYKIICLSKQLKQTLDNSLIEIIPAYQSLTLCYDPLLISTDIIRQAVDTTLAEAALRQTEIDFQTVEIPVCYDEPFSPDLEQLAKTCHLSKETVIERHVSKTYLVHMLGFLPGFLYLGGLDPSIACPRKSTPVIKIPAGAVAIGGNQTGIYPITSPGGWHIIGQTPLTLFKPQKQNPFIAQPLDKIKFIPINQQEYYQLLGTKR